MPSRHFEAFIFSVKAAVSAVVAVVICHQLALPSAWWSAVSAVLVSQPSLHSSLRASLTRVMANLIGAGVGAVLFVVIDQQLVALALGVLFTGMACYYLKAEDAMRPAFAAVIIVIFNNNPDKWAGSLDRVETAVVGCLCSLLVGVLFMLAAGRSKPGSKDAKPPPEHTE
jgi:uncharacterized membrane protein YgaE (UPF0421/DUF939 family)